MTVEREALGFTVMCDHCSDFLEVYSPDHDWSDVLSEMRREGYRATKNAEGEWEHTCPSCQEDGAR